MISSKELIKDEVIPLGCRFDELTSGLKRELTAAIYADEMEKPRNGDAAEYLSESIDDELLKLFGQALECNEWSAFCDHLVYRVQKMIKKRADDLIEYYRESNCAASLCHPSDREHLDVDNIERARDIKAGMGW